MRRTRKQQSSKMAAIAAIVFIGLMVLGAIGYTYSGDSTTRVRYGGLVFDAAANGRWLTTIEGNTMYFDFTPLDTLNLDIPDATIQALSHGPVIWMTSQYNDSMQGDIAAAQFTMLQAQVSKGVFASLAYTDRSMGMLMQIDCSNATAAVPVILMQEGAETKFEQQGFCHVLTFASNYDIALLRDRVLFELYGIKVVRK